jgi:hypothetical protein
MFVFFLNLALKKESIVNEPHWFFKLQIKNTNNLKSEVRFKQRIRVVIQWCVHNRLFKANFDAKFQKTLVTGYNIYK